MPSYSPFENPNWMKRQQRLNTPQGRRMPDMNDPRQAATSLYNSGIQIDQGGHATPTRDYGSLLRLNSSQMNPLSRGVRPGSFSSLGQPMNSMYANNPGFFKTGDDFASQLAQRNQAMAGAPTQPQAQERPTQVPYRPGLTGPTVQAQKTQQEANRAGLQEQVDAKKMLRDLNNPFKVSTPTINRPMPGGSGVTQTVPQIGVKNVEGKYGTGFSTLNRPGQPKAEGLIGGRPASEVLQGLANKPGLARPEDKYQPKQWTAEELRKLRR